MKCECEYCGGDGVVECDDCNGEGEFDYAIQVAPLNESHPKYDDLLQLQSDAKRVIEQCEELKKMRPDRIDSFNQQLIVTLKEINRQADKLNASK